MRFSIVSLIVLSLGRPCVMAAQTMVRVPVDSTGLSVAVWHLPPTHPSAHAPVLFVHGASFPTKLAAGFKFDGTSWMDHMAARGFDVWGLDFLGYGRSDRYPAMRGPDTAHAPVGRAAEAARQIAAAVAYITRRQHTPRVSLVAHSWGTITAGL